MEKKLKDLIPTRRDVLKFGGLALASTCVDRIARPLKVQAAGKANPRGSARNCLFMLLGGAMSQVDTWDFKESRATPKDLDVQKVPNFPDLYMSKTLFPTLGQEMHRISLVRSMKANALNHVNAQYHIQAGRAMAAIATEIPAFGSIIAYEMEKYRKPTDTFPTYISTYLSETRVALASGFLPARFTGLNLNPLTAIEAFGNKGDGMKQLLQDRFGLLSTLAQVSQAERSSLGSKADAYHGFSHDAYQLLNDPRWTAVFTATDEEKNRYGKDEFGLGCILARNILAQDAGTRFIFLNDGDKWDHHIDIFNKKKKVNHYYTCNRLDKGLISLIRDMSTIPGKEPGKSLLDETLIVLTSEFGRTPDLNPVQGKDHCNLAFTAGFLGGGVKGGRIIGKTDEKGGKVVETGWKHKEQPFPDNLVATIYSALGIDWSKAVANTPSGREYRYVQNAPLGMSEFISDDEISELFE